MKVVRIALVMTALALVSGCYRYVPIDPAAVPVGAKVQARLSTTGIDEMTRYFGPDVSVVRGPLVSWDVDGLSVLRQTVMRREGFLPTTVMDTLHLQPDHLLGVDTPELDGPRTAGLTAVILAGAAATTFLAAKVFGGIPEEVGEGGGPDPEATVLFRIPIGLP